MNLLKECTNDIQNHFISYKLKFTCLDEGYLICYQAGIFSIMDEYYICHNLKYSVAFYVDILITLKIQTASDRTVTPIINHYVLGTRELVLTIEPGNNPMACCLVIFKLLMCSDLANFYSGGWW